MVPPAFLGRTFSVLAMLASLGMPVTLLAVSPVVDHYPAALFFTAASGVTLVMALAWAWVAHSEREGPQVSSESPGVRMG